MGDRTARTGAIRGMILFFIIVTKDPDEEFPLDLQVRLLILIQPS